MTVCQGDFCGQAQMRNHQPVRGLKVMILFKVEDQRLLFLFA